MYPRRLWPAFAMPGVLWLCLLFLVPFYAAIAVAFGTVDPIFLNPVPVWNPLDWNADYVVQTLTGFLPGNDYWRGLLPPAEYVAPLPGPLLLCGYPVAHFIPPPPAPPAMA